MGNTVTVQDILAFMRDNTVYSVTEAEVLRLIKYFVNDLHFNLSYKEFCQMLLPCEDTYLRNSVLSRRPYLRIGVFEFLPLEIEHAISDIILKEIQLIRHMDSLKHNLQLSYDYSKAGAFRAIDAGGRGLLNYFVLEQFFKRNLYYASEADIMAIIRRLDTEGDAQVSYVEFSNFMTIDTDTSILSKTAPVALYSTSVPGAAPLTYSRYAAYPYYSYGRPYLTTVAPYADTPYPRLLYTGPTTQIVEVAAAMPDDLINLEQEERRSLKRSLSRKQSRSAYSPYTSAYGSRFVI